MNGRSLNQSEFLQHTSSSPGHWCLRKSSALRSGSPRPASRSGGIQVAVLYRFKTIISLSLGRVEPKRGEGQTNSQKFNVTPARNPSPAAIRLRRTKVAASAPPEGGCWKTARPAKPGE
jgi:hypothetical protein